MKLLAHSLADRPLCGRSCDHPHSCSDLVGLKEGKRQRLRTGDWEARRATPPHLPWNFLVLLWWIVSSDAPQSSPGPKDALMGIRVGSPCTVLPRSPWQSLRYIAPGTEQPRNELKWVMGSFLSWKLESRENTGVPWSFLPSLHLETTLLCWC